MRVIVYAEDLSDRKDDGHYSMPDLNSALAIFFCEAGKCFLDKDGENELSQEDAEALFDHDRRVQFYNDDGERIMISVDPTR